MSATEKVPPVGVRWHPYADIFPWIEGAAFDDLVEDVRKNGVIEPVVFLDGQVLDGRNRYMAARKAGVPYPRVEYRGDDPLGFVISVNLKRRHLSESQRAMVAAKLAKLDDGQRQVGKFADVLTQSQAAGILKVSERSLRTAKTVQDQGAPELIGAVESGAVSVSAAADVAILPKAEQSELVARGKSEILRVAREIRRGDSEVLRAERIQRIEILSSRNASLPAGRRYPVLYADPPWRYENSAPSRAIERHYPTMSTDEICSLNVSSLATKDAALFLWATAPQLPAALKVIEAWGFEYRSCAVWHKLAFGMGYWFRIDHELLLVAVRGSFPTPLPETRVSSVYAERRGEHSAKPNFFAETIERQYPSLPRLELFSRSPRPGWDVWGNEADGRYVPPVATADATQPAPQPPARNAYEAASR